MKLHQLTFLMSVLLGCSSPNRHRVTALTPKQAKSIAQTLATERARSLYGAHPLWDGAKAQFVDGEWIWTERRGCGMDDMEATVILAPNGSARSVDVTLLRSASSRRERYR